MSAIKVRLGEQRLWWLKNDDGSGPLDLEIGGNIGPDGELENPFGISYAHVHPNGEISRYGKKIGKREELLMNW